MIATPCRCSRVLTTSANGRTLSTEITSRLALLILDGRVQLSNGCRLYQKQQGPSATAQWAYFMSGLTRCVRSVARARYCTKISGSSVLHSPFEKG